MPECFQKFPPRAFQRNLLAALAASILTTFVGCGTQAYEQRLTETVRYYEYRQRVDQALQRNPWQEFGIQFRVPQGFQELPGPTEESTHDPR